MIKSINRHINQAKVRINIGKLERAIFDAIDKISTEENDGITYAEINAALLRVLNSLNSEQLSQIIEKGDKS